MIKINLLPQEMAGGKSSGASQASGSALVALVLILIFGVNILLGGYLFFLYSDAEKTYETTKVRADATKAKVEDLEKRFNEEKTSLARMERLISVAESLDPPDRLLWSRKLNMLPLLVPEGIFLEEIQVSQQVKDVETDESIKARNEWEKKRQGVPPEKHTVPVITQTFNLGGIAYVDKGTETQRLEQITLFYRNLQTGERKLPFDDEPTRFIEGFAPYITPSAVSAAEMEGREVTRFRFTLRTKPLTIQ